MYRFKWQAWRASRVALLGTLALGCSAGIEASGADSGGAGTAGRSMSTAGASGSDGDASAGGGGSSAGENASSSGRADAGRSDASRDRNTSSCADSHEPWAGGAEYYAQWSQGPPSDPDFFPIAVWLQSPSRAEAYAEIGVNLFIGLHEGPTEGQLDGIASAEMPAIAAQNSVGLSSPNASWLWGWMHGDEPDNAQPDGSGGYGPCISPSTIQAGYSEIVAQDATRPVYLNLGRGVAVENWGGRGPCTGQVEDYPEYAEGADIVSFDVYPVNSDDEAQGNLWYVARGVERLRGAVGDKPVWTWIETTDFRDTNGPPTPRQVRAEVWMAIIHGAMGVGYFAHVFEPDFIEAGLLADATMRAAVADINTQIQSLAPVLNTPPVADGVTVEASTPEVEVATLVKRHEGSTYLFAVSMRDVPTSATFRPSCVADDATADVLGESRQLSLSGGAFTDEFEGYAVHLYKIE